MRPLCALLFALASTAVFAQETPLKNLPYTPSLETAFMDRSADACVNFYQYACGNWNKLNPIPADQAAWDVYSKMADDNLRFLWGTLEQAAKGGGERTANEQKIGDYFGACMDTGEVEAAGAKPIEPALAKVAALKSPDDIAGYVGEQHREGIDRGVLFGFTADQDFDDSSQMMAFAGAGGLGLPDRDYYSKTDAKSQEIRKRYVAHVARMLGLLGESGPDADADARAVMEIETALASASLTRTEKRNPYNLKHKMSREELQRTTPAFDWDAFLKTIESPSFTSVNVNEPKFFGELNRQLKERKLADWRAYLRWHLVHSNAKFLASSFEKEDFGFYSEYLQGAKAMPARWKKCTRLVDRQLGEALGQVFVAKTFGPQNKKDALRTVEAIEAEMKRDLEDLSWMSEPTRKQALTKLDSMVNKIGYPDKWRDYSSVAITPRDFMMDVKQAATFEERRTLNKIGKPVDRTEWDMTPPTVNADYNPQTNDMNFPAGVLQPPLFDPKTECGTELRQYGIHDGPRTDARLRRRGTAVRCARQPARLVDSDGREGF